MNTFEDQDKLFRWSKEIVNVYAASKCHDKVALVITYHTKKAYIV